MSRSQLSIRHPLSINPASPRMIAKNMADAHRREREAAYPRKGDRKEAEAKYEDKDGKDYKGKGLKSVSKAISRAVAKGPSFKTY